MDFSQVILSVERFGACVRFYRDLLGCELVGGGDDGPVAYFASAGQRFALVDRRVTAALSPGAGESPAGAARATLAFRAADVDAERERLGAAGVEYTIEPRDFAPWGVRSSLCRDPDGNPVEIFTPLAAAGPGGEAQR